MQNKKPEEGSVDPELFRNSLTLINLSIGKKEYAYFSFSELADPSHVRGQLANQLIMNPGCDIRTQAAYFINKFSWSLACIIGFLDLSQLSLDSVWSGNLSVTHVWQSYLDEGKECQYIVYKWHLDDLQKSTQQSSAHIIGKQLIDLMSPIIEVVYQETGFSKGSQWRLLTDAISAVYLQAGKQFDFVEGAMQRVTDIIDSTGKPLANKSWHFKEFRVDEDESPILEELSGWFRIRGGCCRYYTLSNGHYCSTCVHLNKTQQKQQFEDYLKEQANQLSKKK